MSAPATYLSRVRLRRDMPAAALRAILAPDGIAARTATAHALVWTLFADSPERERDFLWREAEPGLFYCLSTRPPEDRHGLFEVDPPKPFAPRLTPGDRLAFSLRVNATVARGGQPAMNGQPSVRGKPCDIVMDALQRTSGAPRAAARQRLLAPIAHEWLARQGSKHGFALDACVSEDDEGAFMVKGYRVLSLDRGRGAKPLRVGVLDVEGVLTVGDPAMFTAAVLQGFGRAKAFGCGLMLIRRAGRCA